MRDFWTVFVARYIFFQSAGKWTNMKMGHTKQFCRIPRWVHTHADIQSRKHTLTTHVEKHALTTPAAAESGGGGPMGTRGHAQIHP